MFRWNINTICLIPLDSRSKDIDLGELSLHIIERVLKRGPYILRTWNSRVIVIFQARVVELITATCIGDSHQEVPLRAIARKQWWWLVMSNEFVELALSMWPWTKRAKDRRLVTVECFMSISAELERDELDLLLLTYFHYLLNLLGFSLCFDSFRTSQRWRLVWDPEISPLTALRNRTQPYFCSPALTFPRLSHLCD